jgi:hypothetical protein
MTRLFAICASAVCLLLAGCGMVISDRPIFPPDAARHASQLAGIYTFKGDEGPVIVSVRQSDDAAYEASVFLQKDFSQAGALSFSAVPLGNGDYVMQVSCFVDRDRSGAWKSEAANYLYWILFKARPRGDYWIGWMAGDKATHDVASRYGQQIDKQKGIITLSDLAPGRAKEFFREWSVGVLALGGDLVFPIESATDWTPPANAPEFDHPRACRDIPAQKKSYNP